MSNKGSIQTISKDIKKTALDYVLPHNHRPVSLALDWAKEDFHKNRTRIALDIAYEHGATQEEVSKRMGLDKAFISRKFGKRRVK